MAYNSRVDMNTHVRTILRSSVVLGLLALVAFSSPLSVYAAMSDATVSPLVLDGKGKVREILRFHVTITNSSKHLVTIYPWVTDFDPNAGSTGVSDLGGSATKDLGESLARWIEVTRGSVDLLPGEEKEVPLTVQINLNAKPGVYHAVVHFSEGSDRASAESSLKDTEDVPVNIEVLEDINERLQLGSFSPLKNIFSSNTASFQYSIQNIGNRGEVPHGKVRIFDRDGREVATIDANQDGQRLEPAASAMLSSVWAAGGSFGRYKAMIDLEYGNRGTLQDTVFFWMFPWGKLLSMFLSLVLVCVIIAVVFHSRMTASRRGFGYATSSTRPQSRTLYQRISSLWGSDEEDDEVYEEDVQDVEIHTNHSHSLNEMREVTLPYPVRSRLAALSPEHPSGTRLHAPTVSSGSLSAQHRVTLGKVEKPAPDPHHVVNLRK